MGLPGGNHNHIPGTDLHLRVGAAKGCLALEHDEDLGVVVPVK